MEEKNITDTNTIGQAERALFFNNPELLFVFKKTQKVSYALFMVSDLFDSKEPLRLSLRKNATELIKNSLSFSKTDQLLTSLFETLSLCEAGYFAKIISPMNSSLLKKEINHLIEVLDLNKGKRISLNEGFLDVGSLENYKGQDEGNKGQVNNVLYQKPIVTNIPKVNVVSRVAPKPIQKEVKSNRSDLILSLLKKGQELTIKDFLIHIHDCSEKTIQRELLALVAKGLLKKKGERRWSRYSL